MEQHILIIEDDRTLNAGIAFALEKEGYAVHSALSLLEAEKRLDRKMNLILLDVNLPDGDGRDFLQNMLAGQPVPVICLTALDTEEDMLQGFRAGCDDYVTKPFTPMELLARVNSQMRRYRKFLEKLGGRDKGENVHIIGGLEINEDSVEAFVDGEPVKLTPIEYKILLLLMKNPGMVFSAEEIYVRVQS